MFFIARLALSSPLLLVSLSFNFFLCQLGRLFVEFNLNVLGEFQTFSWHFPRLSLVRSWGWERRKRSKKKKKLQQTTTNDKQHEQHKKSSQRVLFRFLARQTLCIFASATPSSSLFCPARRRRHQQMTKFHFYERQSTWNCVRNDRKIKKQELEKRKLSHVAPGIFEFFSRLFFASFFIPRQHHLRITPNTTKWKWFMRINICCLLKVSCSQYISTFFLLPPHRWLSQRPKPVEVAVN